MFFLFIHLFRGFYLLRLNNWFISLSFLHFKLFLYYPSRMFVWYSGWLLFVLSLLESFIGYVQVNGQLSYWAFSVILNLLGVLPILGPLIVDYVYWSSTGFNRIFITHFFIGFVIGLAILGHLVLLHTFTNSIPSLNSASTLIIPFFSSLFKDSFALLLLSCFSFSYFLFKDPDTFGNCENNIYSNPLNTPLFTLPEWYFPCSHSLPRAFPNKTMGVLITVIILIILSPKVMLRSL